MLPFSPLPNWDFHLKSPLDFQHTLDRTAIPRSNQSILPFFLIVNKHKYFFPSPPFLLQSLLTADLMWNTTMVLQRKKNWSIYVLSIHVEVFQHSLFSVHYSLICALIEMFLPFQVGPAKFWTSVFWHVPSQKYHWDVNLIKFPHFV